jgi:hypothetical protein
VYEQVKVTRAQIDQGILPRYADGQVSFSVRELAHAQAPIYAVDERETVLREWSPRVVRKQARVERRSGEVVARYVIYSRGGGDFPSPSHGSGFVCPDIHAMFRALSTRLFIIE